MSMNISQSLLPEFDVEIANTRKTLERVPEGNPDFRPHPKSMTLARLAGHVAEIPMWALMTLGQDELDMNPAGGSQYVPMTITLSVQTSTHENTANISRTVRVYPNHLCQYEY